MNVQLGAPIYIYKFSIIGSYYMNNINLQNLFRIEKNTSSMNVQLGASNMAVMNALTRAKQRLEALRQSKKDM